MLTGGIFQGDSFQSGPDNGETSVPVEVNLSIASASFATFGASYSLVTEAGLGSYSYGTVVEFNSECICQSSFSASGNSSASFDVYDGYVNSDLLISSDSSATFGASSISEASLSITAGSDVYFSLVENTPAEVVSPPPTGSGGGGGTLASGSFRKKLKNRKTHTLKVGKWPSDVEVKNEDIISKDYNNENDESAFSLIDSEDLKSYDDDEEALYAILMLVA